MRLTALDQPLNTTIAMLCIMVLGVVYVAAYMALGLKGVVALFALPVIWWLLQDYNRLYWVGFILIIAIDEFPGGLGEVPERSLRTTFYSKSLGVPGMYLPDMLLFGFLGLFVVHWWAGKVRNPFVFDHVGKALSICFVCIVLSTFVSLLSFDFGAQYILQQSTFTSFEVNQKGLKLIGFFQVKLFFSLFPAYLATLVFLHNRGIDNFLRLLAIAVSVAAVVGLLRFATSPTLLLTATPVVYDSATVVLFCLAFMHFLYRYFQHQQVRGSELLTLAIMAIFLFLVLSSFRRTIWGAFILAMMVFVIFLWRQDQRRAFNLLTVVALLGGVVLVSPIGLKIISLVLNRLFETSTADPSTLYRFVLFKYFVESFGDIPLLGYGIQPLWNEVIRLRFFEANLENVHSLYYWIILRFGLIGIIGFSTAFWLVLRLYKKLRQADLPKATLHHLQLVGYFFFIYLFSGIFNPVYAQFRYAFILGVVFAYLSYLWKQHSQKRIL